MAPRQTIGAKAYHLHRLLRLPWGEIADRIEYRVDEPDHIRRHSLMILAKEYAQRHGFAWPVG